MSTIFTNDFCIFSWQIILYFFIIFFYNIFICITYKKFIFSNKIFIIF